MSPRPTQAVPALLALLLGAGCGSDSNIERLYPDLALAPESLEFGAVVVGEEGALELQVVNAGEGPLSGELVFEGEADSPAMYTISPALLELDAGTSSSVLVTFAPDDYVAYDGNIVVASNDPEKPLVSVPVTGEGTDGGPDIALDTETLDFGEVEVGARSTAVFTLRNDGDSPLLVSHDSQQSGSGAFILETDPRGESIPIGGSYTVLVAYSPADDSGDEGGFTLVTNDPDEPEVRVSFIGNGGGVSEYPVALIDGPDVGAPGETVILDGTGSYDPGGLEPLTYTWTLLERPEASLAELSNTALSAPFLTMDTAGSYTVSLQVENTDAVASSTAVHTVEAVPTDDIYVLLSWEGDDADMDLHLLRDDAAAVFQSPDDACWCNPNPDWGTAGDGDDDPLLALDADSGGGPESIHVGDPADGEYFVRVHYFQDNGSGTTEATVRIFAAGELVDIWRRDLSHNELWEVAYVRWPQGFVVSEDTEPAASPARDCVTD